MNNGETVEGAIANSRGFRICSSSRPIEPPCPELRGTTLLPAGAERTAARAPVGECRGRSSSVQEERFLPDLDRVGFDHLFEGCRNSLGSLVDIFVFPNADHGPPGLLKRVGVGTIALDIPAKLRLPVGRIGARLLSVLWA